MTRRKLDGDSTKKAKAKQDLCIKHRPLSWKDVIGHKPIIKSIAKVVEAREKKSFVLTGPSGVGKTTIARIIASELGCGKNGYREIDAATYSGIDAMKEVAASMAFSPFDSSEVKVICVDEAHALSKPAWQSLLKSVEEPPKHGYWIFCTTDGGKIPETIRTRSACYDLKPVKFDILCDFLDDIAAKEFVDGLTYKLEPEVIEYIARQAQGSPRRALTFLTQCGEVRSVDEAADILSTASDESEAIDLCRLLADGRLTWAKAQKILKSIDDQNPESVRAVIVNYFNSVIANAKEEKRAALAIELISAFLPGPYYSTNGFAELYRDLATLIF